MHKYGLYHRDLKNENIVLTEDFELKLMDFGFAKFADQVLETVDSAECVIRRSTATAYVQPYG